MTALLNDTYLQGHIQWRAPSDTDRRDILTISPSGIPKVLDTQDASLAEFRWVWEGTETEYAYMVAHHEANTRGTPFWIFTPLIRKIWASLDMPCYPRVAHTSGAFSGITKGTDTTINFAAVHGLINVGTNTYVYIAGVVDNGPGGDLEAALNGKLHLVKTWTDLDTIVIDTDTSGCTNIWASGGTAAQATFMIRGTDTSAQVVKDATTTKTLTTHYTIEDSGGTNGEDLIQLTTAWTPTSGHSITVAYIGRRRYLVWYADSRIAIPLDKVWDAATGELIMVAPFNVNEMPEDD